MNTARRLVLAAVLFLGLSGATSAAEAPARPVAYALELPGSFAGWLVDADLGATAGKVVEAQIGASAQTGSALGGPSRPAPITVELAGQPAPGLVALLDDFTRSGFARLTGAVLVASVPDRVPLAKLYFFEALLTRVTLSRVDASSGQPVTLRLVLQPDTTRLELLSGGAPLPPRPNQVPWSSSSFNLAVGGGAGGPLVARAFGPFSCGRRPGDPDGAGDGRESMMYRPGRLVCDPVEAGVSAEGLGPWLALADRSLRQGDPARRSATLTLLAPDLRQALLTVTMTSGFLHSFTPRFGQLPGGGEALTTVGLKFDQATFQFGTPPGKPGALVPAIPGPTQNPGKK